LAFFDKLIKQRATSTKSPLTSHPAFPLVVAIWFGVLLGLGSLILPSSLYASLFEATGIASLFSPLAPPIDFATRGLIAVIAAIAGAAGGYYLARRVIEAAAASTPGARLPSTPRRKPINAHEELGEEGFDGNGLGRKRPLSIRDIPAAQPLVDMVPLPGTAHDDHDLNIFGGDFLRSDLADDAAVEAPAPAQAPSFARWEEAEHEAQAADDALFSQSLYRPFAEDLPPAETAEEAAFEESLPIEANVEADDQNMPADPAWQEETPMTASDSQMGDQTPLDDMVLQQLVNRLATSMARRRQLASETAAAAVAASIPPVTLGSQTGLVDEVEAAEAEEAAKAMAAYFGGSAKAAEPEAAPAANTSFPAELPTDLPQAFFKSAEDDGTDAFDLTELAGDEVVAEPHFSPERPFSPAPFAGFPSHDDDYDDDEDDQAFVESFNLPFLKNAMADGAADQRGEGRIASLLGGHNPFASRLQEFVRAKDEAEDDADDGDDQRSSFLSPLDDAAEDMPPAAGGRLFDPPRAAHPGNPREHSAESESALRGALETLRRLSGAA